METSGCRCEATKASSVRHGYAGRVPNQLVVHASASARLWRRSRRVAAALGTTRAQRAWLRIAPLLLLWLRPVAGAANRGLPVSFGYRGNRLTCVLGEACEYEVLEEVFVDEVYGANLPDDAETIVDLGGHVGLSTLYFAVRYPRARIVIVEPNPAVHRRLRRNTVGLGRAIIDAVAVAGSIGETGLRTGGSSWAARLDDRAELRVQTVTLSVLFARHALESVDLLKFDIEGAEHDALDLRELDRVAQIVGEVHARGHEQLEMLVVRLEPAFDVETRPLEPRWLLRARRRASGP
jgi:FkbM family methyltransferase